VNKTYVPKEVLKDVIKMQTKSTQRHKKAEYEGPTNLIGKRLREGLTLVAEN
jgi:hypothetical protein